MTDNFPSAVAFTLREEGGLSDDANDPGGLTKYGISAAAYPSLDISNLTQADAEAISRRDYWMAIRADDLPAGLDALLFDDAVNRGVGGAARLLQRCLGVDADGSIGPLTLAAVAARKPSDLIEALRAAQEVAYRGDAGFSRYGRGWLDRLGLRFGLAWGLMRKAG